MQSRKRWHFIVILIAICLTIYNILPTIFYYAKPLKNSIDQNRSVVIGSSICNRINQLEDEAIQWVRSFCKLLKIHPSRIEFDTNDPQKIILEFPTIAAAKKFRIHLPRAGSFISFVPAQLSLYPDPSDYNDSKKVIVQRQIPLHFSKDDCSRFFLFSEKFLPDGSISETYKKVIFDRAAQLAYALAGPSETARLALSIYENPLSAENDLYALAHNINDFIHVFGEDSGPTQRYIHSFLQDFLSNPKEIYHSLLHAFSQERNKLAKELLQIKQSKKTSAEEITTDTEEHSKLLSEKDRLLMTAESFLKKYQDRILSNQSPLSLMEILATLDKRYTSKQKALSFSLEQKNPFISEFLIDFSNDKIFLYLHDDLLFYRNQSKAFADQINQIVINEIARIGRIADEKISAYGQEFVIQLNHLTNSKSFLVFQLEEIAKIQAQQLQKILLNEWNPQSPELASDSFPIYSYEKYLSLAPNQKALGLIVYAPITTASQPLSGMHSHSIYVIAKGLNRITQKYQEHRESSQSEQFFQDLEKLKQILKQNGFIGYEGSLLSGSSLFANDFVFEQPDYYRNILAASREDFSVHGSKRFAILEFTDVEQRLLTQNQIETKIHEDLIKWKDDYKAAQTNLQKISYFEVPKPPQNIFLDNMKLSFKKYFRGDERKILHWGLDLSGGKTVQIELRDQNNHTVTNEADLNQGMNELYNRVNKMGISEVNIRTVDNYIVLDFPGSQGLSASELVKASSMFFHVVNEKFSLQNKILSDSVNQFLQEIWNEAVVTNKKDSESINMIAWKHLYGESAESDMAFPRSNAAKILYENGLRLASPLQDMPTANFNDSLSKIGIFRGEDFSDWQGQSHPLLIVFNNYSLEGSDLTQIHSAYDPSKGNYLSFEVKGSRYTKEGIKINPRDELYRWTSQFSREGISGTILEQITQGRGWRMAVILNERIISGPPTLDSALRDRAMITGNFSQREVNQLVADLKAGSLSFTPKILSEKNVSPELGQKERLHGIIAMIIALIVVIAAMIGYYRFAGIVASVAVLFNLLIIWATLQNLQATLTLAGLAGIILTVGMAVDANVLVFERIREEFSFSNRLISALQTGYRKAFSAIFDSNITTIIAALILLHFDSGPIKGFAVTLIIGIVSSMFSALFMTRYFFTGWAENPKHKTLKMCQLIKIKSVDFLKKSKYVIGIFLCIIALGSIILYTQRTSIIGLDFTGGFSLSLEVEESPSADYRQQIEKALLKHGVTFQDFQVRELTPRNHLRLLLGTTMEQQGRPFYQLPIEMSQNNLRYSYENNPRILWIVKTLEEEGIKIKLQSLQHLDQTWTSMSGQMSNSMRNNAIMGLSLAFIAILIYLTFRFEFKFAASALICLFHDVLITVATIALLHACRVPIQFDLHTIAALMTIIGYSLNDTIIIFDRIREDMKLLYKQPLYDIVNHSLNITLSRTTITSLTTLLALLPLVIFGGSTIFSFAFVMILGIFFGTFSSIFIASPLMLFFHKYEIKKQQRIANLEKSY